MAALSEIRDRLARSGVSAEVRGRLQEIADGIRPGLRMGDPGRLGAVLALIETLPSEEGRRALREYARGPADSHAAGLARRAVLIGK